MRRISRGCRGVGSALALALAACEGGTTLVDPPEAHEISVPAGFVVDVFTDGLTGVRTLKRGPGGALFAVQSNPGRIVRFVPGSEGGTADEVVSGLRLPYGLAFHDGWMYVAETHRVVRFAGPDWSASRPEVVVPDLPTGGHWTREIAFAPDGRLWLAVGSSCNVCEEANPYRAAVWSFAPDGSDGRLEGRGLRNAAGLAVHPATGAVWATQNERDHLGEDLPPEEINVLSDGLDFGWPYCYGAGIPNPEYEDEGARCAGTVPPALALQAHSAPLGMTFYDGERFPAEYRGDLFVAFHGSWNRTLPTGYKLVRVRVADGRPAAYEDFATGWLGPGGAVRGRPVYPAVGADGALYLSDDGAGRIWRIRWTGTP